MISIGYFFYIFTKKKLFANIKLSEIKDLTNYYSLCLIARRSRHHAGARYQTRGLNEEGWAGNFVETE